MEALTQPRPKALALERLVVALHCAGGTPGQWRPLAARVDPGDRFMAPAMHGAPGGPRWSASSPFRLNDDAQSVLAVIGAHRGPIHLAGHSYGGALALHIAALAPERIASMALYEPTPLHLLPRLGRAGLDAMRELEAMNDEVVRQTELGKPYRAVELATDYWSSPGTPVKLKPAIADGLVAGLPQLQRAYEALLAEVTEPNTFSEFAFPVRLIRGALSPSPARILAEGLAYWIPGAELITLEDTGHMGPITDPDRVAALMQPI